MHYSLRAVVVLAGAWLLFLVSAVFAMGWLLLLPVAAPLYASGLVGAASLLTCANEYARAERLRSSR